MNQAHRDQLIEETHANTGKMVRQVDRNTTNIAWLRWLLLGTIGAVGTVIKMLHFK